MKSLALASWRVIFEDVSERQIDPPAFVSTFFTDAMQPEFLRGAGHD